MKNIKIKREIYFDYLRIFAIFLVIGIHIAGVNWHSSSANSITWKILNVYDSMFRCAVPIFIMISGALFLNKQKELNIKKLYLKNILRLVIALIFWSLAYSIFHNIILPKSISINSIKATIIGLMNGHYHLWFITMLIGLYIAIPILKKICEDKKIEEYFLIIAFIFTFILSFVSKIPVVGQYLGLNLFNITVPIVSGYSSYFILGHYLNTYQLSKKKEKLIYILGAISVLFTITATYYFSIYKGYPSEAFYNYLIINTLFVAIAVFIFFKNHISKVKRTDKFNNIVLKISNLTFGIYLVHDFFITIFTRLELINNSVICSVLVPLIAIVIFILSLICSYILSKIPILNKYII